MSVQPLCILRDIEIRSKIFRIAREFRYFDMYIHGRNDRYGTRAGGKGHQQECGSHWMKSKQKV
jgi:hypothetical protein